MHTGYQDEDTEEMKLTLKEDFLHQKLKAFPSESSQKIEKLQTQTEQPEQKIQELAEKVEAVFILHKRI